MANTYCYTISSILNNIIHSVRASGALIGTDKTLLEKPTAVDIRIGRKQFFLDIVLLAHNNIAQIINYLDIITL